MRQTCIGLDLSLTATGFSHNAFAVRHMTIAPRNVTGHDRLEQISKQVLSSINDSDFVVMEDLAFSMNNAYAKENAGLAYLVRHQLWLRGIEYKLVTASALKKFVTGKGNAEKSLVLKEVYKRWGVDAANDNEADAVGLLYIGLALTGQYEPTTDAQREVLAALRNPKPKKARVA